MKQRRTVLEAKRYGFIGCLATDLLQDIATQMVEHDISALVVTTPEGALAGVISRTDVLRAYWETDEWGALPVSHCMSTQVITVTPQTLLREVVPLLIEHHIHRVVVVDEEEGCFRPLGVLSSGDLVYHLIREIRKPVTS